MTSFCSDIVLNMFKVNIKYIKKTFTFSKSTIETQEQGMFKVNN